jgi:hypothetical protein
MNRKDSAEARPSSMESVVSSLKSETSSRKSSQNILIQNHIKRTDSEEQLCMNKALAECRDSIMYDRIVNGIRQQQANASSREGRSLDYLYETEACIQNVNRTRCMPFEECASLHSTNEKMWNTLRQRPTMDQEPWREPFSHSNSFLPPASPVNDEEEIFIFEP